MGEVRILQWLSTDSHGWHSQGGPYRLQPMATPPALGWLDLVAHGPRQPKPDNPKVASTKFIKKNLFFNLNLTRDI